MNDHPKKLISKISLGAAVFTVFFGMAYIIVLFVTLRGLLKPAWDMAYQVLPSIFLALSFLVFMITIYNYVPDERKILEHLKMS